MNDGLALNSAKHTGSFGTLLRSNKKITFKQCATLKEQLLEFKRIKDKFEEQEHKRLIKHLKKSKGFNYINQSEC